MFTIDYTISLGNLITGAGFLFGGISFVYAVRQDVSILSERLKPLEEAVKKLTSLIELVARQDERLNAVERDMQGSNSGKNRRKANAG